MGLWMELGKLSVYLILMEGQFILQTDFFPLFFILIEDQKSEIEPSLRTES